MSWQPVAVQAHVLLMRAATRGSSTRSPTGGMGDGGGGDGGGEGGEGGGADGGIGVSMYTFAPLAAIMPLRI